MRTYDEYRLLTERSLVKILKSCGDIPEKLYSAMEYSLMAGGKRLRPVLLLAAAEMAGMNPEEAMPYACALEMIHTYSLIHDDLPGMDNDDLRRGKPTNHKVFGEGIAILAGDGLLSAAMEIMLKCAAESKSNYGIQAAEAITRHAGVTGMIAGQTADITLEGSIPEQNSVRYIHTHKTSDLLQAPMEAGLLLAGCRPETVDKGSMYGFHLGLAFQIVDDILDITGDSSVLGKNTGSDTVMKKMTWVAVNGMEAAKEDAGREIEEAIHSLKDIGYEHSFFDNLARDTLMRVK